MVGGYFTLKQEFSYEYYVYNPSSYSTQCSSPTSYESTCIYELANYKQRTTCDSTLSEIRLFEPLTDVEISKCVSEPMTNLNDCLVKIEKSNDESLNLLDNSLKTRAETNEVDSLIEQESSNDVSQFSPAPLNDKKKAQKAVIKKTKTPKQAKRKTKQMAKVVRYEFVEKRSYFRTMKDFFINLAQKYHKDYKSLEYDDFSD